MAQLWTLLAKAPTGLSPLNATVYSSAGLAMVPTAPPTFETYSAARLIAGAYAFALPELGARGTYSRTLPAGTPDDTYTFEVSYQSGSAPAESDTCYGTGIAVATSIADTPGTTALVGRVGTPVTTLAGDIATRLAATAYAATTAPTPAQIAAAILKSPANLLATDASGLVTSNNSAADTPGIAALLARIPGTVQPQSGDAFARLGAPAGASLSADVAVVAAKTSNLPADPASNTVVSTRLAATSYSAPPTAQVIAQAVLTDTADTSTPGSLGAAASAVLSNLDAAVSSRSTYSGGVVAGVAAPVTVGSVTDKSGYLLAAAGLDAVAVEPGVNARQALSPILAAAAGTLSGAGTGSIVVRAGAPAPAAGTAPAAAPATRIVATTDSSGNRASVGLYLPA